MAAEDAGGGETSRARRPTVEDLKRICRELNARGVRYVVVGGMAMNFHGYPRATHDIDLLVDASPEAVARIKDALSILEDKAALEIGENDIREYVVVRVADEVVVDLIGYIGEMTVETAQAVTKDLDGVLVPFADLDTLIETKRGLRDRDMEDLRFLLLLKQSHRDEP